MDNNILEGLRIDQSAVVNFSILHGNCLELFDTLDDNSIDACITESQDDVDGLDAEFGALFGALGDIMNESADPTTETPAPRPAVEQKQFVTAAIAAKNNAAKHTKEVPSQPKPGMFPTADSDNAKLAAKGDLFKKTLTENFVDEDNATLIEAVIKVFDLVVLGR